MPNFFDRLSEEFDSQYLLWEHPFPSDFVNSQWQYDNAPDGLFLAYRVCHFIGFLLALTCCYRWNYLKAFGGRVGVMYLANWSYGIAIGNSLFGLICIARQFFKKKVYLVHEFPWWYKFYWALHSIALDLCFSTSLAYWVVKNISREVKPIGIDLYHVWNSVLMLIDLFMVPIPLRLAHIYSTMVVCFAYTFISATYYFTGGSNAFNKHYIFPVADWRKSPTTAMVMTCIGAIYLFLVRILIMGLYYIRCWIYKTYFIEDTPESVASLSSLADFSIGRISPPTASEDRLKMNIKV